MLQMIPKHTEEHRPGAKPAGGHVTTQSAECEILHLVTEARFLQVTSNGLHHHRLDCQMEMYVHIFASSRLQFLSFSQKYKRSQRFPPY